MPTFQLTDEGNEMDITEPKEAAKERLAHKFFGPYSLFFLVWNACTIRRE